MALIETEGIIIATKNWGSADKLITIFTRTHGKFSAVAYGCRRPKSPLAALTQPFVTLHVQVAMGDYSNTIRQCEPIKYYTELYSNLTAMAYASFIMDLLNHLCHDFDVQPAIYDKLVEALPLFTKKNPRILALALALQLLEFTGYQLTYDHCVRCGSNLGEKNYFSVPEGGAICAHCHNGEYNYPHSVADLCHNLLKLNWHNPQSFMIKGADLLCAEQLLLEQLNYILERPLKSLEFIKQIGE